MEKVGKINFRVFFRVLMCLTTKQNTAFHIVHGATEDSKFSMIQCFNLFGHTNNHTKS